MGEPNRPQGVLRVGLGLAQVMGATVACYLLLTTGMSNLTVWATTATLFFLVVSKVLFSWLDRKD